MKIYQTMIASLLVFFLGHLGSAQGAIIPIVNASFENLVIGNDGFTDNGGGLTTEGWTGTPTASGVGIFRDTSGVAYNAVPDGFQTAYSNSPTIEQTLTTNLTFGLTYTLTVAILEALNTDIVSYTVQLLANDVVLAQDIDTLNPADGEFLISTVFYHAQGSDPIGSALQIRLLSGGAEVGFDDVNLTSTPLPAALPLMGAGLAVMGFMGWRKRKKASLQLA